ncbi:MAG: helix-turn-helix domain-containing protein [bacterium]
MSDEINRRIREWNAGYARSGLTVREAAAELGYHWTHVYRLIRGGQLRSTGAWFRRRIARAEVDRFGAKPPGSYSRDPLADETLRRAQAALRAAVLAEMAAGRAEAAAACAERP